MPAGVIIGVTVDGRKELVTLKDAYLESEANLAELLNSLRAHSLTLSPKLAKEDGVPLLFSNQ
ncbi:MAG: hypothetical protein ACTS73_02800 [Arsenophonus sp. NEOnobi-MAG3]